MTTRKVALAFVLGATLGACSSKSDEAPLANPLLEHGRQVFLHDCVPCHGEDGRGDGPVARSQPIPPRDFVAGDFKFSSGGPGTLPTDEDLFRTVTNGVATSTMPSFAMLDEGDRRAVVQYVKHFCPRFQK